MTEQTEKFESWALVELMGHRRVAGFVTEQTIGGSSMLRIDIPAADGDLTQIYSGSAVYCLTPCTEDVARRLAGEMHVRPAHLLGLPSPSSAEDEDDFDYD